MIYAVWNGLALGGYNPIKRLLPAIERVSRDIDAQFVHLLASPNDPRRRLYEAIRHAAIGGGKRLRPLLVQATCELFNIDPAAALRFGVAIECIHVYSLVHADLPCMDDDDILRGKPTRQRQYDDARAGLVGVCVHSQQG